MPVTATLDESLAAYATVNSFFPGHHNRTTLVVADSYNEYRLITGIGDIPEEATACNFHDGPRGIVAIKSPALVPNYRQILTYHLARIMERTIPETYHSPPEWFQDGLAAYVASHITDDQRAQAAENARTGKWMTLPELERAYANMTVYNENSPESMAVKAQSFLLVEHVGNTYGNRTLVNILTDFGDCGNINQSFKNRTSLTADQFNEDLRKIMIGPVVTPVPTQTPEIKEYLSGYVRDGAGNPLADKMITITGDTVNTTVPTDMSGYYAAEVSFGVLNVNMKGAGFEYDNTVSVNPGENRVYNITIAGLNTNQGALPGLKLPEVPAAKLDSTVAVAAIVLVDILALIWIIRVFRRNL